MFTIHHLDVCIDHLGSEFFKDKKILVLGHLSKDARVKFKELGAHLNCPNSDDVIIHVDLLNNLGHLETHLEYMCKRARYIILETDVLDTSENICTKFTKGPFVVGVKPSASYIENCLKSHGFASTMMMNPKLNHNGKSYDWPVRNTFECHSNQRRFFITKKQEHGHFSMHLCVE